MLHNYKNFGSQLKWMAQQDVCNKLRFEQKKKRMTQMDIARKTVKKNGGSVKKIDEEKEQCLVLPNFSQAHTHTNIRTHKK